MPLANMKNVPVYPSLTESHDLNETRYRREVERAFRELDQQIITLNRKIADLTARIEVLEGP